MSFAYVQDVAASWEQYDRFAGAFAEPPDGLILHIAGPTDEGFRTIDIWESEEACRRFHAELLREGDAGQAPLLAPPVIRALQAARLIYGQRKENDDA